MGEKYNGSRLINVIKFICMNIHHFLTYQTSMYTRECISSKFMEIMTEHNNDGYAMLQHFCFCLRSSFFAHHMI